MGDAAPAPLLTSMCSANRCAGASTARRRPGADDTAGAARAPSAVADGSSAANAGRADDAMVRWSSGGAAPSSPARGWREARTSASGWQREGTKGRRLPCQPVGLCRTSTQCRTRWPRLANSVDDTPAAVDEVRGPTPPTLQTVAERMSAGIHRGRQSHWLGPSVTAVSGACCELWRENGRLAGQPSSRRVTTSASPEPSLARRPRGRRVGH